MVLDTMNNTKSVLSKQAEKGRREPNSMLEVGMEQGKEMVIPQFKYYPNSLSLSSCQSPVLLCPALRRPECMSVRV